MLFVFFLFFTRLAFSCIWEMNHKAEILKTRFTKSAINSKVKYQHADTQAQKICRGVCIKCPATDTILYPL